MTQTRENPHKTPDGMHGDEALEIFNQFRHHPDIDDHTWIEDIGVEFPWLTAELGEAAVHLARLGENKARTFKVRGASVGATALMTEGYRAIQTPSAGNAGRSAALVGKILDIPTRIVVPRTAPEEKREGIRRLWPGGMLEVREEGEAFDEALEWAYQNPDDYGLLLPYDDPNVIRGQGTVVDDIVGRLDHVEHIVTPVGGAGLIAGIVNRLNELGRQTMVHGVEAEDSNSLSLSMAAGEVVAAHNPNKKYGGSAVKKVGEYALDLCLANQEMIELTTVTDQHVAQFIDRYAQHRSSNELEDVRPYEPTTLVAMAALAKIALRYPSQTIVALGTGHNDSLYPEPTRGRSFQTLSATFLK